MQHPGVASVSRPTDALNQQDRHNRSSFPGRTVSLVGNRSLIGLFYLMRVLGFCGPAFKYSFLNEPLIYLSPGHAAGSD